MTAVLLALAGQKFGKADLAARPEDVVLGDEPVERGLHHLGQGVIGRAHIGELGLAATQRTRRRHRHRIQHPEHDRHRHVRSIAMPQPIAEAVEPPPVVALAQPPVFVQI